MVSIWAMLSLIFCLVCVNARARATHELLIFVHTQRRVIVSGMCPFSNANAHTCTHSFSSIIELYTCFHFWHSINDHNIISYLFFAFFFYFLSFLSHFIDGLLSILLRADDLWCKFWLKKVTNVCETWMRETNAKFDSAKKMQINNLLVFEGFSGW